MVEGGGGGGEAAQALAQTSEVLQPEDACFAFKQCKKGKKNARPLCTGPSGDRNQVGRPKVSCAVLFEGATGVSVKSKC